MRSFFSSSSDVSKGIPSLHKYPAHPPYKRIRRFSQYLTMRDGVRIAITVFLPQDLPQGTQLPTLLHQTRYWRLPDLRWPLNKLSSGLLGVEGQRIEQIIRQGYAFVNVDARGSGASYGKRDYPWTKDEVDDGVEIVDWIVQQSWSDGGIGTVGISYSATAGEFLITRNHPNVKAGALLFSLFDVYEDIAFPGGIPFSWFTKEWGFANSELDHNRLPIRDLIPRLLVKGVAPVNGDRQSLEEALKDHEENVDLHAQASQVTFRDEVFDEATGETIEVFSPHTYLDQINSANIPLYCYSGWYDGAYCHSAIRRFANLTHPDSKLILGPWEHRGRFNISPTTAGKVGFDHLGELLKFFDCHLKGKETGIKSDAKVHYFTMGTNKWKASEQWPPKGVKMEPWYFNQENSLSLQKPKVKEGKDRYVANEFVGTGEKTRWRSMVSKLFTPKAYPDLAARDQQRLCFTSTPLSETIEISGHPLVKLFIQSTAEDGSFHVYLEDVDPNGKVRYVTEGMLRALHRKISRETPPYKDWVPYRTYIQADAQLLTPGKITELYFDMLPVSYAFLKGHQIRIAVTCHDADHFYPVTPNDAVIHLYRNVEWASCCELPVVGSTQS